MSKKAPIATYSTHLTDTPALRAWNKIGHGAEPTSIELWRQSNKKPTVYRLIFESPRHPSVFAKYAPRGSLSLERGIYEDILPRLPVSTPRYFGFHADADGSDWLFLEDVGGDRLSARDPAHRVLAARWLAALHRAAADLPAAQRLPAAGATRYLAHLRSARAMIRRNMGNRGLTTEDRALLVELLAQSEAVEARWDGIERACAGLPETLVHGDFQPKNVRVRENGGGWTLYPIDWEMAGFGIPAADLAPARGPDAPMQVDVETYAEEARTRWPELDAAAVRKLAMLGRIFRTVASIDWECLNLVFETPDCLIGPLRTVRLYSARITDWLAAAPEWL